MSSVVAGLPGLPQPDESEYRLALPGDWVEDPNQRRAARHDLRQLRRHSPWGVAEWQSLEYGYRQACGHSIEGEAA